MAAKSNRTRRRRQLNEESSRETSDQVLKLQPKTLNQARLVKSIRNNHVTIASGSAGVGKTLVALHEAVWMMEKGVIDQILYTKPIISFREQNGLGFLPGDLNEKVLPLLAPLLDNLEVFVSPGKIQYLLDKGKIKYQALEYLRGRSLRNTFIVADEFQGISVHGAITVISRIEESSKLVMLGDPKQQDILLPTNALTDALVRLKGVQDVGIIEFSSNDIVRNAFLKTVLSLYD